MRKLVVARTAPFKIKETQQVLEFTMPLRNEAARRARERARDVLLAMPISDDESLMKLQDQAEEYLREAKRRDPSEPDELLSTTLAAINRKYFLAAINRKYFHDAVKKPRT
jgi:hypothetical protein